MKALKLVFALVRVPRLFLTLFFFPLLLSLVLVYMQLLATGLVLKVSSSQSKDVKRNIENLNKNSLQRKLIFGSSAEMPPLLICRWLEGTNDSGEPVELPPSEECLPDRLDAAVQVSNPLTFDATEYQALFAGNVYRLHICRSCQPDIVVKISSDQVSTHTYSVFGFLVLQLALFNTDVQDRYLEAAVTMQETKNLLGQLLYHPSAKEPVIGMSNITSRILIPLNIALLILVALWLALKAHRKILDYFAKNGALLPMVAATGGQTFYSALWLLTLLRVVAFLGAAVPLVYIELKAFGRGESLFAPLLQNLPHSIAWLCALAAGLALAGLIASIAELKQRRQLLSFCYRYVPLALAALGAMVWAGSFLFAEAALLRSVITATPIIGLAPIMVAPLLSPTILVLATHTLASLGILLLALRRNSQWFAAHLEEL